MAGVSRRDPATNPPFPLNMPAELYTFHAGQPEWVTADNTQSWLHETLLYKEDRLRGFVEVIRGQIGRSRIPDSVAIGPLPTPQSIKGTAGKLDGNTVAESTSSE